MNAIMPSQAVDALASLFPDVSGPNFQQDQLRYDRTALTRFQAAINVIEHIPLELITVSGTTFSDYLISLSRIRSSVELWKMHTTDVLHASPGKHPLQIIIAALKQCPDAFPPPADVELLFINDPDLRADIRADVAATRQALLNHEWKAATVLAGATMEALLWWKLHHLAAQNPPAWNPPSNFNKWMLDSMLAEISKHSVIKPDTMNQARLAQNFRNLIHPGRAERLQQQCTRGTAYGAASGMELVITDLT